MFQLDIKEARTGKIQLVNNMRSQNMFQKQILNDCQSIRFEIYFKMKKPFLPTQKITNKCPVFAFLEFAFVHVRVSCACVRLLVGTHSSAKTRGTVHLSIDTFLGPTCSL